MTGSNLVNLDDLMEQAARKAETMLADPTLKASGLKAVADTIKLLKQHRSDSRFNVGDGLRGPQPGALKDS